MLHGCWNLHLNLFVHISFQLFPIAIDDYSPDSQKYGDDENVEDIGDHIFNKGSL